mmetsp:Transcript_9442/g.7211  ORF Transcript_9442/g.7211 Transcript_9442/m.7211 type:complete len:408 (-) Transcript_9442:33-1256(-)
MLGWAQEHGPFVMEDDTNTFHYNEYSWNTFANVLYIESPGGVGFSTCGSRTDCTFTDTTSAQDNFDAVVYWFSTLFPEYASHELYITGESYAGIYVPYLFDLLATYVAGGSAVIKNLKGFMVGNGCTNWNYDTTPAFVEMAYWHGMYDDALYKGIKDNGCESQFTRFAESISARCLEYLVEFERAVADINVYDVYGKCYSAYPTMSDTLVETADGEYIPEKAKRFTARDYTPWLFQTEAFVDEEEKRLMDLPPCTFGGPIIDYLNSAAVREALHIPDDVQEWTLCTDDIVYRQENTGSQWVYEKWIMDKNTNYRMLHYSGDVDGSVPTYGTLGWIDEMTTSLGMTQTTAWYPFQLDGQVAGYYMSWDDGAFDFASVHGAGHMVPQFKRAESYVLFTTWIKGEQPPGF